MWLELRSLATCFEYYQVLSTITLKKDSQDEIKGINPVKIITILTLQS